MKQSLLLALLLTFVVAPVFSEHLTGTQITGKWKVLEVFTDYEDELPSTGEVFDFIAPIFLRQSSCLWKTGSSASNPTWKDTASTTPFGYIIKHLEYMIHVDPAEDWPIMALQAREMGDKIYFHVAETGVKVLVEKF